MYFWFTIKTILIFHLSYKKKKKRLLPSSQSVYTNILNASVALIAFLETEVKPIGPHLSELPFWPIIFKKEFLPISSFWTLRLHSPRWLLVMRIIISVNSLIILDDIHFTLWSWIPFKRLIIKAIIYWATNTRLSVSLWPIYLCSVSTAVSSTHYLIKIRVISFNILFPPQKRTFSFKCRHFCPFSLHKYFASVISFWPNSKTILYCYNVHLFFFWFIGYVLLPSTSILVLLSQ